jgi:Glycosyl transferase family 2
MSRVDVVIPCYNYGKFLADCVTSVLDDELGSDVRVLIIDDASQDDSADIARMLAESDSRVEVVVHPANRGPIATFNEGVMDLAEGDYCVQVSADDMLTPGALRRAIEFLDEHPNVGFVYGHAVEFRTGEPPTPRLKCRTQRVFPGHWWLERRFREPVNHIASPEVVVRTSLQHEVGGYDLELTHTGDAEMWMRLAAHADVGYLGVDQAYYRRHDTNMSHAMNDYLVRFSQLQAAYDALLERCAAVLPDAAELSRIVHRRLAHDALWIALRAYDRHRTDRVPVDELVAFAFDCWPDAARLGIYRSLQLRRFIGPSLMPYFQPLIWSAVVRDLSDRFHRYSWERRGI